MEEQLTPGIPISCGPSEFTIGNEYDVDEINTESDDLQQPITVSKATFKLFNGEELTGNINNHSFATFCPIQMPTISLSEFSSARGMWQSFPLVKN